MIKTLEQAHTYRDYQATQTHTHIVAHIQSHTQHNIQGQAWTSQCPFLLTKK